MFWQATWQTYWKNLKANIATQTSKEIPLKEVMALLKKKLCFS